MDTGLSTVVALLIMTNARLLLACPEGTFRSSTQECQRCSVCPKGWGETSACSPANDTLCVPCPAGTFSLEDFHVCEPCIQCHRLKQTERQACDATHDALCGDCQQGFYFDMEYLSCKPVRQAALRAPAPPTTTMSTGYSSMIKESDEVTEVTEAMSSPSLTSTEIIVLVTALAVATFIVAIYLIIKVRTRQKANVHCWSRQNPSTESDPMLRLMVQESTLNQAVDLSSVSLPIHAGPDFLGATQN